MVDKNSNEFHPVKYKPKIKHIVKEFLFLNAINKENACRIEELKLDLELYQQLLNKLIQKNLIVLNEKNMLYYLDYDKYKEYKESEDKRKLMWIISIAIPGIIFFLLFTAWIIFLNIKL